MPTRGSQSISNVRYLARGFTLIDVIVSMVIIAILIAILIPAVSKVNENGRRVVCQSNIRQVGTGVLLYAEANDGILPPSDYLLSSGGVRSHEPQSLQEMITVRKQRDLVFSESAFGWDGLGYLFLAEFLETPQVFYCPSHHGQHNYARYADFWRATEGVIAGNYHYRGQGPQGPELDADGNPKMTTYLDLIDPAQSSLIADGMREQSDVNHRVGANFFRADLTVHWYNDPSGTMMQNLPASATQGSGAAIEQVWFQFDAGATR